MRSWMGDCLSRRGFRVSMIRNFTLPLEPFPIPGESLLSLFASTGEKESKSSCRDIC